jgi:hypothetical protein
MLRFELTAEKLVEKTPTLFIKLNEKTKKPEKAWTGYVYGFKEEGDRIRFKVNIEKTIPLADIPMRHLSLKEGWYLVDKVIVEEVIPHEFSLYPPFFYALLTTRDWEEFESHTYWLLKLIGIHKLHRFERQRGKADGFFIFGNLAVIYDCTLEGEFGETKKQQIQNYYAQLKSGKLEHEITSYNISSSQKQVWIISRGSPRLIKQIDDVTVKEVSVQELIKIYKTRIKEDISEEELEKVLASI